MMRKIFAVLGMVSVIQLFPVTPAVCADDRDVVLPRPKAALGVDLMQALAQRMSVRSYADRPVPLEAVAGVLWAGYGINRQDGKHTVPTALGIDLLDLYVAFDTGTYRYDPAKHELQYVSGENVKGKLARSETAAKAAFLVVLVGKTEGFSPNMPPENSTAYVNCTAGAAAENMYLAAGALDLGTVIMASIRKDEIVKALKLPAGHAPLYVMPFGYRR